MFTAQNIWKCITKSYKGQKKISKFQEEIMKNLKENIKKSLKFHRYFIYSTVNMDLVKPNT